MLANLAHTIWQKKNYNECGAKSDIYLEFLFKIGGEGHHYEVVHIADVLNNVNAGWEHISKSMS